MMSAHPGLIWCGIALASLAMMYSIAALLAVRMRILPSRSAAQGPSAAQGSPPVTVLKPLCGAEHEIYQCLRSFCDQDYPQFQLVFGVSDSDDPAIAEGTARPALNPPSIGTTRPFDASIAAICLFLPPPPNILSAII